MKCQEKILIFFVCLLSQRSFYENFGLLTGVFSKQNSIVTESFFAFLFVKGSLALLDNLTESGFIHCLQFLNHLLMFEMGDRNGFFPAYDCASIDMKHLGKDFLRDAEFLSEVTNVSWRSADERLWS